MKRQHRIFFDPLRIIHRKQILKEDLDREFNRDALYFAYVATKNKELLSIYQKSEKGDVKVCRAFYEMFEESTNRGIQMVSSKALNKVLN